MEAICKADFDRRVKAHNDAVDKLEKAKKEKKPRKKKSQERKKAKKEKKPRKKKSQERKKAKKEKKPTTEIIVPEIVFHDIYGVWFFGQLQEVIRQIGTERFGVELDKMMYVFVDEEPKKIADGIHDILV